MLGSNPNNVPLKKRWWAYQAHRPDLYAALRHKQRVLAVASVSNSLAFVFLPTGMIYSHQLILLVFDAYAVFGLLQSRPHEIWTRFLSSSLKDDVRYTPSDCFETFPFPKDCETDARLEAAGKAYYDFCAALMVRNNEGLTKTYNRFHDPEERDAEILRLRGLHDAMDRAVLDAYGWTDLQPTCEFLLDYEDDDPDADDDAKPKKKKKPWRYRWPDDLRDEVLARLLALNQDRAKEEALSGAASQVEKAKKVGSKRKSAKTGAGPMFEE